MMKNRTLIALGALIVLVSFGWSSLSRNTRIGSALVGGIVLVIGLAPRRLQIEDPTHPAFKAK